VRSFSRLRTAVRQGSTRVASVLLGHGSFDEGRIARRALRSGGTLVDVGAHTGSTAAPFASRGWHVYAIEPVEANLARLQERLRGCPRVVIDTRAVSNRSGELVTLYTSQVSSGIATLAPFHPSHQPNATVRTVSLAEFCLENRVAGIDVLKIDTEGFDLFVLQGHDWSIRPRIVICEFEDRKTVPLGYCVSDLAWFLLERQYQVLVSEWYPIEEYGREHRWWRYFEWGDDTPSPSSWGNLIAARRGELFSRVVREASTEAQGARRRYITRRVARAIAHR
jgi:FkbM family methyltransferase